MVIRATENSTLWGFFGEMGVHIKNLIMQVYCAQFYNLLRKISINEINFFTTHLDGNFGHLGELSTNYLIAHRLRIYAKFGVCSSYGV